MLWTSYSLFYIALQSETPTFPCLYFWKRWALESVGGCWMLHNGRVNYLFLSPILSMYSDVSFTFFLLTWQKSHSLKLILSNLLCDENTVTTLSRPSWHTHIKGRQFSGYLFINDSTFIANTWSLFVKILFMVMVMMEQVSCAKSEPFVVYSYSYWNMHVKWEIQHECTWNIYLKCHRL